MALLLFLVCAAISAIVLAAASASVGQFANAGQADQRYYSVTSAAQLFRDSLNGGVPAGFQSGAADESIAAGEGTGSNSSEGSGGGSANGSSADENSGSGSGEGAGSGAGEGAGSGSGSAGGAGAGAGEDGTLTFTFTQTKVGTQAIVRTDDGTTTEDDLVMQDAGASATFGMPANTAGFDFLPDLTLYALVGKARAATSDEDLTNTLKTAAADGWDKWIEPFKEGGWASVAASSTGLKSTDVEYRVQPTLGAAGVSADDLTVEAIARLRSDWTLQLQLHNKTDVPADQYRLLLVLAADVTESVSTDEQLGESVVDSANETTTNIRTVTATKTTVVTWHLGQVVSGRGLQSDE